VATSKIPTIPTAARAGPCHSAPPSWSCPIEQCFGGRDTGLEHPGPAAQSSACHLAWAGRFSKFVLQLTVEAGPQARPGCRSTPPPRIAGHCIQPASEWRPHGVAFGPQGAAWPPWQGFSQAMPAAATRKRTHLTVIAHQGTARPPRRSTRRGDPQQWPHRQRCSRGPRRCRLERWRRSHAGIFCRVSLANDQLPGIQWIWGAPQARFGPGRRDEIRRCARTRAWLDLADGLARDLPVSACYCRDPCRRGCRAGPLGAITS